MSQWEFEQEYLAQYNPPEQPGRRRGDHIVVSTNHIADAMDHAINWINPFFYKPFEKILGSKYRCKDCKYHIFKGYCNECTFCSFDFKNFILSDKTREIINHIMREGDDLGVDVHPRYFISNDVHCYIKEEPVAFLTEDYYPRNDVSFRQAQIKLELIL